MNAGTSVAAQSHSAEWLPHLQLVAQKVFEIMLGSHVSAGARSQRPTFTAMVGLAGSLRVVVPSLMKVRQQN